MIATIAKRFSFDAAHHLPDLPEGHKCGRLHGHTYEVEFVFRGVVGPDGFVMDYAVIEEMWKPLHAAIDHRYLNDIPGLQIPSTEHVAAWLFVAMSRALHGPAWRPCRFPYLTEVTLRESSTTWCKVTDDDITEIDHYTILKQVAAAVSVS